MVYAQFPAEHAAQPLGYLHRQCNLGQQVEHLLVALDGLLDEVNVYLGLSARRHPVEQHHVFLEERKHYLVVSPLLRLAQLLHAGEVGLAPGVQPAHLACVGIEQPSLHQGVDDGRGGVAGV